MKKPGYFLAFFALILLNLPIELISANSPDRDKTLSPYFWLRDADPELDQLPLKSTSAKVNISGVIADVTVTQVYKNEGKRALEAMYIFPASTQAAVYGMKMTIGERSITAKIEELEEARRQFEQAREEGRRASLLEQNRPNVFQMNVTNIQPGDVILVELKYTELLKPTEGIYSFVYPTVVGPRYSETPLENAPESEKWIANPYLKEGEAPLTNFALQANIVAGMAIRDVKCPSHEIEVSFAGDNSTTIFVKDSDKKGGNRDFILNYRLQDEKIQSGLLLSEDKSEKYFLLMMQPPQRVTKSEVVPREYIFIMDVSGSMSGFPLQISKKLMTNLLQDLRPQDQFNVMVFAGSSGLWAKESQPATEANLSLAFNFIDSQRGGGGTRLLPALERALALSSEQNMSRSVIVVTDGYVDVERQTFDLIRRNLDRCNFFAFGIGTSVNRYLIEGMANVGRGEHFIVTASVDAEKIANAFQNYVQHPVLTNIKVQFEGVEVVDVQPEAIQDVFAQRPVLVYGKWRGAKKGTVRISGSAAGRQYEQIFDFAIASSPSEAAALKFLWARQKLQILSDYSAIAHGSEAEKQEIIELGLRYNLLTRYTSFIAIDTEIAGDGKVTVVKQPLPLPQGVSNAALGGLPSTAKMVRSRADFNLPLDMESSSSEPGLQEELLTAFDTPPEPAQGLIQLQKILVYPESAVKNKIEGKVVVRVLIGADGKVLKSEVLNSLHDACDKAAVKAIETVQWKPALQQGRPVRAWVTVPVHFRLKKL